MPSKTPQLGGLYPDIFIRILFLLPFPEQLLNQSLNKSIDTKEKFDDEITFHDRTSSCSCPGLRGIVVLEQMLLLVIEPLLESLSHFMKLFQPQVNRVWLLDIL
eukprot:CAMPEP_0113965920 /NCGR_PEP_ID=MMETSP0011_2-20120614/8031_1 /TAXON_ID=101924 /ORGANISM="Rhodosorus marinus" /LENGTH=103 /DNA_ID=CAMNT_0000978523 /DNA_START=601 /DNA_END=912 /DNA_ORIENTATION=+ /assembly_acc=CAM_ASM_000156